MNDLVTVIIPIYNVEAYLDRCMRTVLKQTYTNLEIILVDDKSTDRSNEICRTYLSDNRVAMVVHKENKGLSEARNSGLDASHGKYAVFIDSDDYIELDMIENLYSCLLKTGADTVIGGFKRVIGDRIEIRENGFAGKTYDDPKDIKNLVLKKMLAPNGIDYIEMSVWKVLFSMDIIQKNHLRFPERKYLCEDIIFDFLYYPLSKKVAMCDDTGYCYCLNEKSLSQSYQKNRFDRILFQASEMRKRAEAIDFDEEAFIRIDNFYIGNLIHHMKTMAANISTIGKEQCKKEFKRIYEDQGVQRARWSHLEQCYRGRDKIPFYLLRNGKINFLYLYLRLLTSIRSIVRR